jgi:exopolysaccharide biosynthesis polyprenyl glycosylphosphotransferase
MTKDRSIILLGVAFSGDALTAALGLVVAHWVRFQSDIVPYDESWWTSGSTVNNQHLSSYLGPLILGTILLLGTFVSMNLYRDKCLLRFRPNVLVVTRAVSFWLVVYLGASLVMKFSPPISRIFALLSAVFAWAFVLLWRFAMINMLKSFGVSSWLVKRLVFLGWSDASHRLVKSIEQDHANVYSIVGVVLDTHDHTFLNSPTKMPVLGYLSNLDEILRNQEIDILVRSDGPWNVEQLIALSTLCDREMVEFKIIPSRLHSMIAGLHIETISGVPILGIMDGPLTEPVNRVLKRAVDIMGATVGLVISAPLLCLFGGLVYLESPGPIIYRQTRTGRRGRNFQILKIRSMRINAELHGGAQWAKKGDDRRLKIGAFMRATNIDEVPQFWNVLKGEMSLVGPRPERPELIAKFQDEIPHYNARHTVKPGMTGWAQVNGFRGNTDLTERVRYDLYYIENWTLLGDFWIMLKTFYKSENAY